MMRNGVVEPVWAPEDEGAGAVPAPAAPTPDPATPPTPAAPDSAPEPAKSDPAAAAAPAKPEPPKPDWKDRRIAELTARLRNTPTPQPQAPTSTQPDPVADFERRVAEAAARQAPAIAAQQKFDADCAAAVESGRKEFGKAEFDAATATLQSLVTPNDQSSQIAYFNLIQSALDTGEPAKLLFELGNDPDEAMRLMAMPPRRMVVELTKRAVKAAPADVSAAPRPITPVDSRGGRHEAIDPSDPTRADNISTQEWMRRRNEQVAAQAQRR